MYKQTNHLLKGLAFFLSFFLLPSITTAQQFQPLFNQPIDVNNVGAMKKRSRDTKMSTDLLMMVDAYKSMKAGQSIDDVMPNAKEFLIMQGDKVGLQIVASDVAACETALRNMGATHIVHFKSMVNCMMPMAKLEGMSAMAPVRIIKLTYKPFTNIGAATSQGDIAQLSNVTRAVYSVNGAGSKIGVISDSYDDLGGAAIDIASGDLPGAGNPNGFTSPVQVILDFGMGGSDEGRAMMQIVHDVAPGAELAFNTAFLGQPGFAQGILDLNTAGCNIIVDDIIYFDEPYYMPGIVSQAVTQVCAAGSMYFSSAGNADRDSYESMYTNGAPLCPFYLGAHEFAPGDQFLQIDFPAGFYTIVLQWDEPFYSVTNGASPASDVDLILWDENLNFLTGSFGFNNDGTGDAFEALQGNAFGTLNFSFELFDGPVPNRMKLIIYGQSPTWEYGGDSPTLVGHANTEEACAVGASAWFFTPAFGFGPPAELNSFSSWGGVPIVMDATGALLPTPIVFDKPDFVAPDGGNTSFFASDIPQDADALPNFFGTSASAPHAAAAAALVFEANPGWTKTEVKASMENTAQDMLTPGFDYGSGAGLINVGAAVSNAIGANAGPNCRNLNASIAPDGFARITLADLLQNAAVGLGQMSVKVERGPVLISYREGVYATDPITLTDACALIGQELKVTISNSLGTCWSLLTLKNSHGPVLYGRNTVVYCDDDLVHEGGIGGTPPTVLIACNPEIPTAQFVADWVFPYACVPGVQDTVKVIVREWEALDKRGNRGVGYDTIVVLQFPEIDAGHIYCAQQDTVYCADTTRKVGPFITYDNFGTCDTLYLMEISDLDDDGILEFTPTDFDDKCGLTVHLDAWQFGGSCETQYKVVLELKQSCYGSPDDGCTVNPPAGMAPNLAEQLGPGYWRCEFWLSDLDTLAPVVMCKDTGWIQVYTNTHECAAHSYLPSVTVADDWSGVKQVKAEIEGIGTAIMLYNAENKCYESHTQFKLAKREAPYKVVYTAYDSCHNVGYDSCFIHVKDNVRPIAVADKGVTVSLSDKKVWVDATTFDEGSWDNCGINFLLARRSDWYDHCIDLCDSIDTCWVSEHHDTLWGAHLQTDKHLDAVEAHYAKTLDWLCNDGGNCGEIIYNAWQYDLMKYGTQICREHPYDFTDQDFRKLLESGWYDGISNKFKNGYLIGSTNNAELVRIDHETGHAVLLGSLDSKMSDIQYDKTIKKLYGTGNGDSLYQIDPLTGRTVSTVSTDEYYPGAEFVDHVLYVTEDEESSDLIRLNTSNGIPTVIGDIGFGPISGLAYDKKNGIMYGLTSGGNPCDLITIDLKTGEGTLVGATGYDYLGSLEFGPNGKLYATAVSGGDAARTLLEINTSTGAATIIGSTGYGITGLTYVASDASVEAQIDLYEQIGGGWSDAVPFSCEDACGPVTVEILVMDYWCNWSTAWTKVWVEDKTPVQVVKDVVEQEVITCKVYKENNYGYPGEEHPVSIQYIVDQAKAGEQAGFDALDGIFGGYCKAWRDPYGNYVDIEGTEIDCDLPFYDSICYCKDTTIKIRVYDEHLGYLWIDSLVKECYYEPDTLNFQKGVVVVNCAENVHCEQEVWCEFDHCGQGYIFRKFKIWSSCAGATADAADYQPDSASHIPDTIYRHQRIWVGNECPLNKYMFDVPYDIEVFSCDIQYGTDGNVIGAAGPENTGYATYKFDDDCRIVGIAHEDKVFKVVGGEEACYKIIRTWYFADWCGYGSDGAAPTGKWWLDESIVTDYCVQKIIVKDTIAPFCIITGPVATGDSVSLAACDYDLDVTVDAIDACGVISYYWELKNITEEAKHTLFDSGNGNLEGGEEGSFDISAQGLYPGTYKLKVEIKDDCSNESYCEYVITVTSGKKPSPVCITSLTARLTPWDSDGDGEVDTAHAVVWAYEYDRSSEPACEDDSLEYRLEIRDGSDDDLSAAGDLDFLELGCDDIGTHLVRLWVISHPSGSRDYCDAVLIVQSDGSGCSTSGTGEQVMVTESEKTTTYVSSPGKDMIAGDQKVSISGDLFGTGTNLKQGYHLEQNRPNPFQHETQIGFTLPESMEASIEIYDVNGRLLKKIAGDYAKGHNAITLDRIDLQHSGVLYYRLQAGSHIATKRMILID